jgi:hypothetical protein
MVARRFEWNDDVSTQTPLFTTGDGLFRSQLGAMGRNVAAGYHSGRIHEFDCVSLGVCDDRVGDLLVSTVDAENDDEWTTVFNR